jgi:excisionase family DNA binding protein
MAIRSLSEHPLSFVTVRELAEYWLVSQKQIRRHVASGCLQGIRVGPRLYRITVASALALEQAFERSAVAAATQNKVRLSAPQEDAARKNILADPSEEPLT